MSKKAVWLSDIEFIEMHSSDWERLESEAFEADESVQAQLNENQQIVLDWLKANVEQDNASPMCAVFLLGEWQTRIGSKELRSVDISYCCLNSKQQAEVLNAFSQWTLEQEESE
ncbi:hypothetical protein MT884_001356 [Enterococcus faecalis]|nr:hypothetical protein [Enterococcus faecalis]